jgi:betaine reductase
MTGGSESSVRLEIANHAVADIRLSDSCKLESRILFVGRRQIETLMSPGIRLEELAICKPGQSVRIAPVLDVVEPRAKEEATAAAFPGFFGKESSSSGQGRTHALKGVAVVGVAELPGVQEGLIDMQAAAAPFSPFARTLNIVLHFAKPQGISVPLADAAFRESTLRVAEFLGALSIGMEPDRVDVLEWPLPESHLPKAALVYFVQSQGNLRRTYLNGQPLDAMPPMRMSPLQVADGALVSGNFVMACNKTCTYIHQNNPLIAEMFRQHGKTLDFKGVFLSNEMSRLDDKQNAVQAICELIQHVQVAGVVINQEGGANTLTDVMMLCGRLEPLGIKTVLILNEFAGGEGTTPSLAETTPAAGHIVSTGNNDYPLSLPAVESFVGSKAFPGVAGAVTGRLVLPLTRVHSSTNQLGFNRLSCRTDGAPMVSGSARPGRPWRVVHYLNQFFGQIGGEDKANAGLQVKAGPVGPGLALKEQLGERAEVVATVICGDNTMAENLEKTAGAAAEIIVSYQPDLLIAGPCFNAGRYGMACGAVCKAIRERLRVPAVMGIAETNPAVEVYRKHAFMVPAGNSAAKMRQAVKAMVDVACTLAEGRYPEAGSFLPRGVRELTRMDACGGARAVAMLAARLSGVPVTTELPLPKFDRVDPAPPLRDVRTATIVLATEGGLAPQGNPDGIEMSMATRFGCYSLEGMDRMDPTRFAVAHGGYDNRVAQEDPNRLLPLDILRELEREKAIGRVADFFYTTSGNATSVENATRFGTAIAEDIRKRIKENVGVIFTAT